MVPTATAVLESINEMIPKVFIYYRKICGGKQENLSLKWVTEIYGMGHIQYIPKSSSNSKNEREMTKYLLLL